jgi:ATP-binding protein involved in chromosome partitioning
VTESDVLDGLRSVMDPDLGRDIVALGFVTDIVIKDGVVSLRIELTTPACPVRDTLRELAEDAVRAIPGVKGVHVQMTAQVRAPERTEAPAPGVKHVIAVASGKGGVGKSTVACNVAVALAQTGARVGLLDADIYGPTVPLLMGVAEEPEIEGEQILPIYRHGVYLMSMGLFLESDRAVVWRGPMVGKALQQFFQDVAWGELDYLIVDLPPGTGDAPMSLAQLMPLTGVVIVMTPQDVAQRIANKAIVMFRALEESTARPLPILGIVENMSGFACPRCATVTPLFGAGGGRRAAERLEVPFLGAIPIDPTVTESGDAGQPAILVEPESAQAEAFRHIAGQVAARISALTVA